MKTKKKKQTQSAGFLGRLLRANGGAYALHFALALPVMLTAIFGAIELGRLGFSKAALQFAAEEATRYAIVREGQVTSEEIEAFAASKLTGVFDRSTAVIAAVAPPDEITGTSRLSVQVTYQYEFLMPFLPHDGIELVGNSSGFIAFAPGSL